MSWIRYDSMKRYTGSADLADFDVNETPCVSVDLVAHVQVKFLS